MKKANLEIYRDSQTNIINIRIVDRINKKVTEAQTTPREFSLILTGLFNCNNCGVVYRDLDNTKIKTTLN